MVNREKNFNRKYQKRLLTIRHKKRAKLVNKEKKVVEEKKPEGNTKKMAKRQERYNRMSKNLKINVADLFKKLKKNNPKKLKKNKKAEKMEIE
jgi:hypothetical protein